MSNNLMFRNLAWETIDRHVSACGGNPDLPNVKEESHLHTLIGALSGDDDALLWAENQRLKEALITSLSHLDDAAPST